MLRVGLGLLKNEEEHEEHLREVLSILKESEFYAKLSKCSFYRRSTKFLGFVVTADGVSMDPDKVAAIENWPLPEDASQLRSFLGLCNHCKRFIAGYSTKISALTELTKANAEFNLEEKHEGLQAFAWLKTAITSAPILAAPDFNAPFFLVSDASGFGIGAVPQQKDPERSGVKRPLAYHSARLSDAEKNYPVGEQELFAVISALKKWRCYLEGSKRGVTIITDHLPNTFLDTKSTEQFSRRQARWQIELSRFDLKWVYEKGQSNAADPLSRCPALLCVNALPSTYDAGTHRVIPVWNTAAKVSSGNKSVFWGPPTSRDKERSVYEDGGPALLAAVAGFDVPDSVNDIVSDIAEWCATHKDSQPDMKPTSFTFRDRLWRYGELIVVPEDSALRHRCITINHDVPIAGHPGRNTTLELVQAPILVAYYQKRCKFLRRLMCILSSQQGAIHETCQSFATSAST